MLSSVYDLDFWKTFDLIGTSAILQVSSESTSSLVVEVTSTVATTTIPTPVFQPPSTFTPTVIFSRTATHPPLASESLTGSRLSSGATVSIAVSAAATTICLTTVVSYLSIKRYKHRQSLWHGSQYAGEHGASTLETFFNPISRMVTKHARRHPGSVSVDPPEEDSGARIPTGGPCSYPGGMDSGTVTSTTDSGTAQVFDLDDGVWIRRGCSAAALTSQQIR